MTINPAIQLGIEEHVGSIEKGKDADLVIFDRIRSRFLPWCRRRSSTAR